MKKSTIVLGGLLALLLAFQASEILRTPNTLAAKLKGQAAFAMMKHDLTALYRTKGSAALEQQCNDGVQKWGYHFTCYTSGSWQSTNGQDFTVTQLVLFQWSGAVEAGEMAAFHRSVRHQRSSYGLTMYPIGGAYGETPYYLNPLSWVDAKFIDLERHPITAADIKDSNENVP